MAPGERSFLEWLMRTQSPHAALEVPVGDDAAVWTLPSGERLVLAADALAEGTHFRKEDDPRLVGRKALAVNLSDLAAMGAEPLCALATCALPAGFPENLPRRLVDGMRSIGDEVGCPLIGGDTVSHAGGVVLSVTVLGRPHARGVVTRSGARKGDLIAVTGALGGSRAGRHLTFTPRLAEASLLLELGPPSAMIDVSDGVLLDLHSLADASQTGFRLDLNAIPLHPDANLTKGDPLRTALRDGEDFELLFTLDRAAMDRILASWSLDTPVSVVGEILPPGTRVLSARGHDEPAPRDGYEHA